MPKKIIDGILYGNEHCSISLPTWIVQDKITSSNVYAHSDKYYDLVNPVDGQAIFLRLDGGADFTGEVNLTLESSFGEPATEGFFIRNVTDWHYDAGTHLLLIFDGSRLYWHLVEQSSGGGSSATKLYRHDYNLYLTEHQANLFFSLYLPTGDPSTVDDLLQMYLPIYRQQETPIMQPVISSNSYILGIAVLDRDGQLMVIFARGDAPGDIISSSALLKEIQLVNEFIQEVR